MRIEEKKRKQPHSKDFNGLTLSEHTKYRITRSDRMTQEIFDDLKPMTKLFRSMRVNAYGELPRHKLLELQKLAKITIPKMYNISEKNMKESKTLYQIHREHNLNLRKLIYTLRLVNFPLRYSSRGRNRNFIEGDMMPLFLGILSTIKSLWRAQDNKQDWINKLKERGFNKSYISKLMSRRIKRGKVPAFLFDFFPPTNILIKNLLSNDLLTDLFTLPFDIMTASSCKERIKQKIKSFLEARRGLLK